MIRKILKITELINKSTDEDYKEVKEICTKEPHTIGCLDGDPLISKFFKLEFERIKEGICLKIYEQEIDPNKFYYGKFISEDEGEFVSNQLGTLLLNEKNIKELRDFIKEEV